MTSTPDPNTPTTADVPVVGGGPATLRPAAVFAEGRNPDRWREPIRDPLIAASANRIVCRAQEAAGTPIPAITFRTYQRYAVDGDRSEFESVYFARRRRLFAAAIGALLSEEVPLTEVENLMWAVCDEYAWALPPHIRDRDDPEPELPHAQWVDLYAAETAFILAEISNLLADRLDPLVRHRAGEEVERRVLVPFRQRKWNWEKAPTNWAGVCAAGVGLAAMHLGAEGLEDILVRCTAAMGAMMSGYGDDGVCVEGLNYWTYGFGHFVMYAEALRQCKGTDLWLGNEAFSAEKLAAIAGFAAHVSLGGRAVAAFSDSAAIGEVSPAMIALLEERDPTLTRTPRSLWSTTPDTAHNWGLLVRTFVWARDAAPADSAPAPDRWFDDAEWLIAKRQVDVVGERIEVGFAAKGGHNAEPHNHNDLGSFVLAVDGEPLLSELGSGLYNRDYFDEATRYHVPTTGSHGHSVPIIDGVRQRRGAEARAEILHVSTEADAAVLALDLTRGYDVPGLASVRRELRFTGARLELRDAFATTSEMTFTTRLVSLYTITLDDDGATICGERAAVRVRWDAAAWRPSLVELLYRIHGNKSAVAHALNLTTFGTGATCVVTIDVGGLTDHPGKETSV
jgi:hypothetical protein